MLPRILIADDLTGAADSGVHFASVGACIAVHPVAGWRRFSRECRVRVYDTETRSAAPNEVREHLRDLATRLRRRSVAPGACFKKIDSTLHGPISTELDVLVAALRARAVVVCPALPKQGRTTIDGRLVLDGIATERVAEVLGRDAAELRLADVRRGTSAIIDALDQCSRGTDCIVVDAETDADLDLVAAALKVRQDLLPVGSSGLASAYARQANLRASDVHPPQSALVLVLVGSSNPAALEQFDELCRAAGVLSMAIGDDAPRAADIASDALRASETAVVAVRIRAEAVAAKSALDAVQQAVTDFTTELRPALGDATLVLTGGATAVAACRALGIERLRPRGELLPGVVWSLAEQPARTVVVTKAGGFGDRRLLARVVSALTGERR
jgi:uncharacterized protein YgbK (DUF1537 family)